MRHPEQHAILQKSEKCGHLLYRRSRNKRISLSIYTWLPQIQSSQMEEDKESQTSLFFSGPDWIQRYAGVKRTSFCVHLLIHALTIQLGLPENLTGGPDQINRVKGA